MHVPIEYTMWQRVILQSTQCRLRGEGKRGEKATSLLGWRVLGEKTIVRPRNSLVHSNHRLEQPLQEYQGQKNQVACINHQRSSSHTFRSPLLALLPLTTRTPTLRHLNHSMLRLRALPLPALVTPLVAELPVRHAPPAHPAAVPLRVVGRYGLRVPPRVEEGESLVDVLLGPLAEEPRVAEVVLREGF